MKQTSTFLDDIFRNANNSKLPNEIISLQQDGVPPHYARSVAEFLNIWRIFLEDGFDDADRQSVLQSL